MKRVPRGFLVLALGAALAGCGPSGDPSGLSSALPPPAPERAAAPATPVAEYRVSRNDVLEVSVFQLPDLSRSTEVDGSGNIALPLIGAVPAAGKTVRELENEIKRRLGARYLQNPQVTVSIKDAVGQRITIDGAVRKAGIIQARGQTTLLQAIAESGGFTEIADQGNVIVIRMTEKGRMAARFDANAIRAGQMADPTLYGGDTIIVDDSLGKTAWKQFREAIPVAGLFKLF